MCSTLSRNDNLLQSHPSNPYLPNDSHVYFSLIYWYPSSPQQFLPTKRVPCLLSSINYFLYPSSTPTTLPTKRLPGVLFFMFWYPSSPQQPLPTKRLPGVLFFMFWYPSSPQQPLPTKRLPSLLFFYLLISFLSPATPTYHTNPRPAIFSLYFDTIVTYLPNDSHDIVKLPVPFSTPSSLAPTFVDRIPRNRGRLPSAVCAMEARARIKSCDYFNQWRGLFDNSCGTVPKIVYSLHQVHLSCTLS